MSLQFECSAVVLGLAKGASGSRVNVSLADDGTLEANVVRLSDATDRQSFLIDPAASGRAVAAAVVALFAFAVGDPLAAATYDALVTPPPAAVQPAQSSATSE